MLPMPFPSEDAFAVDDVETVELQPGQKATIRFAPTRSGSTFYTPVVAMSKERESSYEVKLDGSSAWGPAAIPPTDIDDLSYLWVPSKEFEDEMVAIIKNLGSNTRQYHVLPVGWED